MDLERVYKSRLDQSHAAGLQAVFEAGHRQAREEFQAGVGGPELALPTASAGETSDEEKDGKARKGKTDKDSKAAADPAA